MATLDIRPTSLTWRIVRGDAPSASFTFYSDAAATTEIDLSGRTFSVVVSTSPGGAQVTGAAMTIVPSGAATGVLVLAMTEAATALLTRASYRWRLRDDTNDQTLFDGLVLVGTAGSSGLETDVGVSTDLTVYLTDNVTVVATLLSSGSGSATPSGAAGGVLGGTYPNPTFAADMATQAELNAHDIDTTAVHGIANTANLIVEGDARLTDARIPTGGAGGALSGTFPNPGLNTETVEDVVGAMVTGNTETGGTLVYNDGTGKIDLEVTGDAPASRPFTLSAVVVVDPSFDPDTDPVPLIEGPPIYLCTGVDAATGLDLNGDPGTPWPQAGLYDGHAPDPGTPALLTPHPYEAQVGDGWFTRGMYDLTGGAGFPQPFVFDGTTPRIVYISPVSLFDRPIQWRGPEISGDGPTTEVAEFALTDPAAIGLAAGSTNPRLAIAELSARVPIPLGNVDNTSDVNKPVSTAQQTAIDAAVDPLDVRVTDLEAVPIRARETSAGGFTLTADDIGAFVYITGNDNITVTFPHFDDVPSAIGTWVDVGISGNGDITFVGDTGVTVSANALASSATGCRFYRVANNIFQQTLTGFGGGGSFQPLDSDLTAIAALTTTAFGRALLELADAGALLTAAGALSAKGGGKDTVVNLGNLTGAVEIDLADGNSFYGTFTGDTVFELTGATADRECQILLETTQDTTPRAATWSASVDWAAGAAPTLSAGSGDRDVFVFRSRDGGTIWYAAIMGQDFS